MVKLQVALLLLPIAYGSAVWDTGLVTWFGLFELPWLLRAVWFAAWAAVGIYVGVDAERCGRRTLWVHADSPMPQLDAS